MTEKDIINLGFKKGLDKDQVIFLVAMRRTCSHLDEGNAFGIKACQNTDWETQANWAIASIKKNDERWQKHLIEHGKLSFVQFFAYMGGPLGKGWCREKGKWMLEMENHIIEIKEEYDGPKDSDKLG